MADICNDDRFEVIKRVKEKLVKGTNIEANIKKWFNVEE